MFPAPAGMCAGARQAQTTCSHIIPLGTVPHQYVLACLTLRQSLFLVPFPPPCGGGGSEEGLTVPGLWGGGRYGPSLGPRWSKVDRGGLGVAGPASGALIRRLLAQWGLPSSSLAQQNEKCLCQSSRGGVPKTSVACCKRERLATGKNPCAACVGSRALQLWMQSPVGSFRTTVWALPSVSQVSGMKNYSGHL